MYIYNRKKKNLYITNRRQLVQRCPAVPTDANNTDGTTNDKSASSITIIALFPLSSSRHLPNLSLTTLCTIWPTWKTKFGNQFRISTFLLYELYFIWLNGPFSILWVVWKMSFEKPFLEKPVTQLGQYLF